MNSLIEAYASCSDNENDEPDAVVSGTSLSAASVSASSSTAAVSVGPDVVPQLPRKRPHPGTPGALPSATSVERQGATGEKCLLERDNEIGEVIAPVRSASRHSAALVPPQVRTKRANVVTEERL